MGSLGKFQKALEMAERALDLNRSVYGEKHPYVANSLLEISTCLYSLGDYSTAQERWQEGYAIYKNMYGYDHPKTADFLSNKAKCLAASGKIDEALAIHREALGIHKKFYGEQQLLVADDLCNIGYCLFVQGDFEEALKIYEDALALRKKTLGEKHPNIAITQTYIDTCRKVLGQKTETVQEEDPMEGILNKAHFQELLGYAVKYLENPSTNILVEKNPSGFVRLRLPIPKDFALADKIETLRLHYWPPELKIDTVEAPHDHPRRFESMILHGGYTHTLYRQNNNASSVPFRMHRVVKSPNAVQDRNADERNIFCLGTINLEYLGEKNPAIGSTVAFPRNLIHQVCKYESKTLTINAVFKSSQTLTYFNVYLPEDNHTDPQREREFLDLHETQQVLSEIRTLLLEVVSGNGS